MYPRTMRPSGDVHPSATSRRNANSKVLRILFHVAANFSLRLGRGLVWDVIIGSAGCCGFWDRVELIGDGADEFDNAFARDGGD
jgi:hypothetical protein